MDSKIKFVFFGSSEISVIALNELEKANLLPSLIVTKPDQPKGRGLVLQPSVVKTWAEKKSIECLTPTKLSDPNLNLKLKTENFKLGVLVSYGNIVPDEIINIFPKGIINLHPSLLPKLRGPSPLETTILNNMKDEAGVSIMLIDKEMDHGPILAQEKTTFPKWPVGRNELENILGEAGAKLLAEVLPKWVSDKIEAMPQDESQATFCKIIEKKDAELDLSSDPYQNFLKIKAYENWPEAYFFADHAGKKIRVKITDADFTDEKLIIKKVIPEGKKEMMYESFLKGLK